MHPEALAWVQRFATLDRITILDIGGRDINGTPRHLFPHAYYVVLDIVAAPNVDIIADAATWVPGMGFDIVLSTELFEHTPAWPAICRTAYRACKKGGKFIATMAGPGRPEHSGIDGGSSLHPGEHYQNIFPDQLCSALQDAGFTDIVTDYQRSPADLRCVATKRYSS